MQCPACHEPVAVWVAFCPHCGTRQSAHEAEPTATEPTEAEPTEAESPELAITDPVQDPSLTAELFGDHDDATPAAGADAGLTEAHHPAAVTAPAPVAAPTVPVAAVAGGQPVTPGPGEPEWTEWDDEEPPRRGAAVWLIGVAAAFVVVTLGFVAWSMMRVDGSDQASNSPTARTTTSARPTPGEASAPASPEASPSASASPSVASPSATPSPSASPVGEVPAGAISCGVSGTGDAAAVFAKDAQTSCPFALQVGNAYRAANSAGAPASITANSPVTGKDYTLVCTGVTPTTCVADTGATVFLTRAG